MRTLDLIVIIIYMLGTILIGLHFAKKNRNTEEYFVGNRNIPGWAIGLSMISTSISSVTFLALPAAAFILDWRQSTIYLTLPIICVVAVKYFIPIFRAKKITTAYSYLEERFGVAARIYGSICFILSESIRLGTVLFLLSIPVSLMTGMSINVSIVVCGIFTALYAITGGIEAVIWTDVVQAVVLWVSGIFVVIFFAVKIPGGLGTIIEVGNQFDKFSMGSLDFDLTQRSFYVLLLLGTLSWLSMYATSQNVIQRYVATKSIHEARKATVICAVGSLPTWFLFFFIGSGLFVYFQVFPDSAIATMESDQVFPYFILNYLPVGISGLIVSGVLAAAMSSLDSNLNSISAICTTDILQRFIVKNGSDKFYIVWAKLFSLFAMFIMIGLAMLFNNINKESMLDLGFMIGGLHVIMVLSFFILGIFFPFVKNRSLWIGYFAALTVNIYLILSYFNLVPVGLHWKINLYWNSILCQATMISVAILHSLIFERSKTIIEKDNR